MTAKRFCVYCTRMAHRCACDQLDSPLRQFLAIIDAPYEPRYRNIPYKRGVPPQVKRRERAIARRHYNTWYTALAEEHGEQCGHCGATDALVLDHILPIAKGGQSELTNMQILCARCNTAKGKLIYDCCPASPSE